MIEAGSTGACPHCGTYVRFSTCEAFSPDDNALGEGARSLSEIRARPSGTRGAWCRLTLAGCPACRQVVVAIQPQEDYERAKKPESAWPRVHRSARSPDAAPPHVRQDFAEATNILTDSPKASAALSRRCLQVILEDQGGVSRAPLDKQIDEVMGSVPPYLGKQLDAVRHIGNFAAHPIKSKSTGDIVDVEAGEAEWTLEVVRMLMEFYYALPAAIERRRAALNAKLADAGKPLLD